MSTAVPSVLRRWLIPSSAALAVVAGGVAVGLVTNAADRSLAPRSAQELLADLLTAHPDGVQGTATIKSDLGLPPLPIPSAGTADLGSLANGTHTLRVWYASPGQARVALLGRDGETDVIINGADRWIWSSKHNTAVHGTGPDDHGLLDLLGQGGIIGVLGGLAGGGAPVGGPDPAAPGPGGVGLDPSALANLAMTFLQRSTDVTTTSDATVAGRSVYELVLRPRDPASLIGSVVLAIDAEQKFPLRFAVNARDGGAPAVEVAFTEVSFTRPDASQFTFNPPPGATVNEEGDQAVPPVGGPHGAPGPDGPPTGPAMGPGADQTLPTTPDHAVVGSGWTSVIVAKAPADFGGEQAGQLLSLLPPVSGDWGSGRLLKTRLVSVLLTDDGRLLAGAVNPQRLYEAAADPAAKLGS